jgi:hypothetical protein
LKHDYLPPKINSYGKLSAKEYSRLRDMMVDNNNDDSHIVAESESTPNTPNTESENSESESERSHHSHHHHHDEQNEGSKEDNVPRPIAIENGNIENGNTGVTIEEIPEKPQEKPKTPILNPNPIPIIPPPAPQQENQIGGGVNVEALKQGGGFPSMFFGGGGMN